MQVVLRDLFRTLSQHTPTYSCNRCNWSSLQRIVLNVLIAYDCLLHVSRTFPITAAQRALATASGEVGRQALANAYLGRAYVSQGDYRRAIDCYGQAAAVFDGARHHEHFGQILVPAVSSRAWLAQCHAELGLFAEGISLGQEGLRIAEASNHAISLVFAGWKIGLLALRQGDLPRALPLLERAMSICQNTDFPSFFTQVCADLGAAYTLGGRGADAVLLLTQALEQSATMESVHGQALCSLSLGEAQMLSGHLEEAHALAERALAGAREHQRRGNEAYALRLLGDIAVRREPLDVEQAETYYQQALALANELGMRPLLTHCHRGLGTLYTATGQREQTRTALTTAIEMSRAMDMTFWLPQTEATLAQVEG